MCEVYHKLTKHFRPRQYPRLYMMVITYTLVQVACTVITVSEKCHFVSLSTYFLLQLILEFSEINIAVASSMHLFAVFFLLCFFFPINICQTSVISSACEGKFITLDLPNSLSMPAFPL